MDAQSVNRAVMSAGLWGATVLVIGMATGADIPMLDLAVDSGIMGASALGSDWVHGLWGWTPTPMTSAVGAGALYTGIQAAYRGDDSYLTNFALAAGNDWMVEVVGSRLASQ